MSLLVPGRSVVGMGALSRMTVLPAWSITSGSGGIMGNNNGEQLRRMATLKDISIRLKSVKNIQKITQSMKMVAAAKYAQAERRLRPARPYGQGAQSFFENVEPKEAADTTTAEPPKPKQLLVLMTSDRGLCGAVHSSIAKEAKAIIAEKPADVDIKIFCVGDKSKASLQRLHSPYIMMSGNEIGRLPPTFEDAATLAQAILNCGYDFDIGYILYNRFRTVVSYTTSKMSVLPVKTLTEKERLTIYDSLDAEVLQCYSEYSLASLLFYAMKECATSEQSSRMTAMDGASKNAGEMIEKLTMQFNRTRQAVITRELIEIISGASAL